MAGWGSGEENGFVAQAESTSTHNAGPASNRKSRSDAPMKALPLNPASRAGEPAPAMPAMPLS